MDGIEKGRTTQRTWPATFAVAKKRSAAACRHYLEVIGYRPHFAQFRLAGRSSLGCIAIKYSLSYNAGGLSGYFGTCCYCNFCI